MQQLEKSKPVGVDEREEAAGKAYGGWRGSMADVENENCLIANRMVYELRLITSLRAKAG